MLPYHPALRFKQGEYYAGAKIARDIQKHVCPRFIIPPPKERDPEKGAPLTPDEIAHLTAGRISKYWPISAAFLDAQYVAPVLGDSGLEALYSIAQRRNEKLVPVARQEELKNPIFRNLLGASRPRLGIYVRYDEIDIAELTSGLKMLGCAPQDCTIFVDFTGAELRPELAAGSVAAVLDLVNEAARWGRVVFQGSAFPPTNPADAGKRIFVPRNEWKTFLAAAKECSLPSDVLCYGDFGADCGEITFPRKNGGSRPIPHLRYTTKTDTLVVRGREEGSNAEVMKEVFARVVHSGSFAGQSFSYADDEIWRRANGIGGCGSASMWREWNMAHHITRVVRDLGGFVGMNFADGNVSQLVEQGTLDIDPA
ncbi:MAG: beta family protein [Kiloniellaceae bacterium]